MDVSPRDYRAWYGLGQTYELVNMPYYALYYFRRWVEGQSCGMYRQVGCVRRCTEWRTNAQLKDAVGGVVAAKCMLSRSIALPRRLPWHASTSVRPAALPPACRAVQLRPHDARMWNAMGHCYQQVRRFYKPDMPSSTASKAAGSWPAGLLVPALPLHSSH